MNIREAFIALLNGKRITREDWCGAYLYWDSKDAAFKKVDNRGEVWHVCRVKFNEYNKGVCLFSCDTSETFDLIMEDDGETKEME